MVNIESKTPKKEEENGYSKTNGKRQEHFVERVSSLPIVQDSVLKVREVASKTWVGRWTLCTLDYVSERQPVQRCYQYIEPHLDNYGTRSLDIVQAKVPLIDKPSAEVKGTIERSIRDRLLPLEEKMVHAYQRLLVAPRERAAETVHALIQISLQQLKIIQDHLARPTQIPSALFLRLQHTTQLLQQSIAQLPQSFHSLLDSIHQQWKIILDEWHTDKSLSEKSRWAIQHIQNQLTLFIPLKQKQQ